MSDKTDISSCTDCHQSLYTVVLRTVVYRNRQLVLHCGVHFMNIGAHNEHHERRDAFCNCYILAVHKIERVMRLHSAHPTRSQIALTLVFKTFNARVHAEYERLYAFCNCYILDVQNSVQVLNVDLCCVVKSLSSCNAMLVVCVLKHSLSTVVQLAVGL